MTSNNSPYHATTPTLTLDIIWRICLLIAEHDETIEMENLNTVRMVSQLCREWRAVIVNSPRIWSKLIHLRLGSPNLGNWRKEVMKRTGDMLLWIRGSVGVSQEAFGDFLLKLLEEEHHRIQRVDLSIRAGLGASHFRQRIYQGLQTWLQLPAPHLEKLAIKLDQGSRVAFKFELTFANRAPALRWFYTKDVVYLHHPQWITQLSSLEVTLETATIIKELILVLPNMVQLEELAISTSIRTSGPDFQASHADSARVPLPELKDIRMSGTLHPLAFILEHLTPHPNFNFFLDACYDSKTDSNVEGIIGPIFTFYVVERLGKTSTTTMSLSFSNGNMTIGLRGPSAAKFHFSVRDTANGGSSNGGLNTDILFGSLSADTFSNVSNLDVRNGFSVFPHQLAGMSKLFSSLHGVRILSCETSISSSSSLPAIEALSKHSKDAILPRLQILKTRYPGLVPGDSFEQALSNFIWERQNVRAPLWVVDLRYKSGWGSFLPPDFKSWKIFEGMKVFQGPEDSPQGDIFGTRNPGIIQNK